MKKRSILPLVLLLVLLLLFFTGTISHATYITYEVTAISENTISIRHEKSGREYVLDKEPRSLKVGDKVRYDKKTNRLRKKNRTGKEPY